MKKGEKEKRREVKRKKWQGERKRGIGDLSRVSLVPEFLGRGAPRKLRHLPLSQFGSFGAQVAALSQIMANKLPSKISTGTTAKCAVLAAKTSVIRKIGRAHV